MKKEIKTWEDLDVLMKAKKPFMLTANGHNGGTAETLDWDGKEITDDAAKLIKEKIGDVFFEFLNFKAFTIICDGDGIRNKKELNVGASRLAKFNVFGDVVVSFPN